MLYGQKKIEMNLYHQHKIMIDKYVDGIYKI